MPTGDPPLTLADLREIRLERLKGVGPALEKRSPTWGCTTSSTSCSTTRAAGSTARRRPTSPTLAVGEEATIFAEVRTVHGRRTRQGSALVEVVVHDGTSMLTITFFNQAWREKQLSVGTEASFFGKLDVYRGQAPDDEPGRRRRRPGRRGRREDGRDRARLPAVGQGRGVHVAAARARLRRAREVPGRAASPIRSTRRPRPRRPRRPHARAARDPPAGVDGRDARGEAPADLRRVPAHAGRVSSRASARSRPRSRASATTSTVRSSTRSSRSSRSRSPATSSARSTRSRTTSRAPRRCTGCCRATSARARPSSRSPRCSSRCRVATRARSWRRPRCSPSSTTSARCGCSKG